MYLHICISTYMYIFNSSLFITQYSSLIHLMFSSFYSLSFILQNYADEYSQNLQERFIHFWIHKLLRPWHIWRDTWFSLFMIPTPTENLHWELKSSYLWFSLEAWQRNFLNNCIDKKQQGGSWRWISKLLYTLQKGACTNPLQKDDLSLANVFELQLIHSQLNASKAG